MQRMMRILKRAGACLLIVVAVLLIVKVVRRNFFPRLAATPRLSSSLGVKINLADVDWQKSNRTLVLVLDKSCGYCNKSTPFYQRILREKGARNDLHVIAVFPHNVEDGKTYLREHGLDITDVRQATLQSLGVRGTPTLFLVDDQGVVKGKWVGWVRAELESALLQRILNS